MGHGNGDCFPVPRSGHPEDVPTDREVLDAIHMDVHRVLAALNALSRAGQHQVDGTRKLIKAIEAELESRDRGGPRKAMIEHSRHCECCPGVADRLAELEGAIEAAGGYLATYFDRVKVDEFGGLMEALRVLAAAGHAGLAARVTVHDAAGREREPR